MPAPIHVRPRPARRAVVAAAAACALAALAVPSRSVHADAPATIELNGGAVAVGVGYSWGSGVLTFQGQKYPLSIGGISIVDIGASKYSAAGTVYNLHRVQDIQGVYAAVEAGAAVAGGGAGIAMQNDKGVVIHLGQTRQGLQFTLAPKGVDISLRH